MTVVAAGVLLVVLGGCLAGNVRGITVRIYEFFTSFMDPGLASSATFRIIGSFAMLLGVFALIVIF